MSCRARSSSATARGSAPRCRFVEAPTLRDDGSLLNQPGYDERTGLLVLIDRSWPLYWTSSDARRGRGGPGLPSRGDAGRVPFRRRRRSRGGSSIRADGLGAAVAIRRCSAVRGHRLPRAAAEPRWFGLSRHAFTDAEPGKVAWTDDEAELNKSMAGILGEGHHALLIDN